MPRLRPDLDIVLELLHAVLEKNPDSAFILSLRHQYLERGGLSKKQLEGLYGKASRLPGIAPGKLATLEAIILRKKGKPRSEKPAITPLYASDTESAAMVQDILSRYPEHKQVKLLASKLANNEPLSPAEKTELRRLHRLLGQKS